MISHIWARHSLAEDLSIIVNTLLISHYNYFMERIIYRHADCYACNFYNIEKERCNDNCDLNASAYDGDNYYVQDTCCAFVPRNHKKHYIDAYAIIISDDNDNTICDCDYYCNDNDYNCICSCHDKYVEPAITIKKFNEKNRTSLINEVCAKRIIL